MLSLLVTDDKLGNTIECAIIDLNQTVEAAQNNFLLKGYFNKKKKAEAKKKEEIEIKRIIKRLLSLNKNVK